MFQNITYLSSGNEIQRRAYITISESKIWTDFAAYTPILCGTIPLSIDIVGSDLDIIMEVHHFDQYKREIHARFEMLDNFSMKEKLIRRIPSVITSFRYKEFDFELFAQPIPTQKQNAYRHMLVEHHLLNEQPRLRQEVINLKNNGLKTEPAFAQVLGLEGDPYEELLIFGEKLGVI